MIENCNPSSTSTTDRGQLRDSPTTISIDHLQASTSSVGGPFETDCGAAHQADRAVLGSTDYTPLASSTHLQPFNMLIPKSEWKLIFEALFKGVWWIVLQRS